MIDYELKRENLENFTEDIIQASKSENYNEKIKETIKNYNEKINDFSKSNLAEYITSRKAILDIFEDVYYKDPDDKSALEDVIHKFIFPMRKTSDEVDYTKHNLWIIDERLSYHYYLSSDLKLKSNPNTLSSSNDRPDLLIYDDAIATTEIDGDRYSSITLVEFKRPNRDDYSRVENPIVQVMDYVETLRENKILDRRNRPIEVDKGTKFYAYIIADIKNTKLEKVCREMQCTMTSDKHMATLYHKELNLYIEIISFKKLIEDSKKRNQILFDKLFSN